MVTSIKEIKAVKIVFLSFKCPRYANGISRASGDRDLLGTGGGEAETKDHILRAKKPRDT